MSILSTDRGWKSDREIIKVSALKLRGQTHSHNLWLLLVLQHIKLISVNDDFVSHLFARNYWLLQNSTFLFSNEPAISIDLMPLFSDFKYLSLALGLLTSVCMLWPLWDISGGTGWGVSSDFKAVDYLYNTVVLRATIALLIDGGIIAFEVSMQSVCNL